MIRQLSTVILLSGLLTGCAFFGGRADDSGDRFARPDQPKDSPSGQFTVSVDLGPEQNGVQTWVPVIREKANDLEVFRDTYAYSSRHGVGITWLSGSDQLWLVSSDVGTAHVDRNVDGRWTKTAIYPETLSEVPEEIRGIGG